jgi:hypothetical protein
MDAEHYLLKFAKSLHLQFMTTAVNIIIFRFTSKTANRQKLQSQIADAILTADIYKSVQYVKCLICSPFTPISVMASIPI